MTGYTVKKKNIDYYKYSGKDGSVNVGANELHAKYIELLSQFKIPEKLTPILTEVLKRKFAEKEDCQGVDIGNIKKRISTLMTDIKTVKKNKALGKVDDDTFSDVMADLEAEKRNAERELERASVNLSNLTTYIDDTIAIACNLDIYWQNRDFDVCQKIQKLVFPKGVKWDKEERCFRTESVNEVFSNILCVSDSYKNRQEKETDKSCDLSSLVGLSIEISNRFLHDLEHIIRFIEWLKKRG